MFVPRGGSRTVTVFDSQRALITRGQILGFECALDFNIIRGVFYCHADSLLICRFLSLSALLLKDEWISVL